MKPVLITLLGQPISSFGLFLLISLFAAIFIIWRTIRVYELDEEKILDLIILTFIGGLIAARVYFVLTHLELFENFYQIVLINKYPGLSFWGGFIGGVITMLLLSKRMKLNFWQSADFAFVGFLFGVAITSFGCLLSSCQYGLPSNSIFAVEQVGVLEKRFPIQIMEGLIFLLAYLYLFKKLLKFHFVGEIASKGLILLGFFKLILENFRGDKQLIYNFFSLGHIWSILILLSGFVVFYIQSKRSVVADLRAFIHVLINNNKRKLAVYRFVKNCYNFTITFKIFMVKLRRDLLKVLNLKPNPKRF